MKLTSPAFTEEGMIPAQYTCNGADISPPLAWEEVPEDAKSLALIVDDPDAPVGTWVHWVLYNLPADTRELKENITKTKVLPDGAMQGTNDFRKIGYNGPCPPGGTHRYFFKLYALDEMVDLNPGARKKDLVDAMKGHILAECQLMGKFSRR
ncbi:MAG: YbhB/YbcL family Raf kinase inhibitor-like protein [Calditrichota bacterium]|jgi:Raf kinase inhibitor-like YbhB/YbcL family protein